MSIPRAACAAAWLPVGVAVGHASCFFDFLDEAYLSKGQGSIRCVSSEMDD